MVEIKTETISEIVALEVESTLVQKESREVSKEEWVQEIIKDESNAIKKEGESTILEPKEISEPKSHEALKMSEMRKEEEIQPITILGQELKSRGRVKMVEFLPPPKALDKACDIGDMVALEALTLETKVRWVEELLPPAEPPLHKSPKPLYRGAPRGNRFMVSRLE